MAISLGAFNELLLVLLRDMQTEYEQVLENDVYARLLAPSSKIESALRALEADGRIRVDEPRPGGPRVITIMPL